MSDTLNKRQDLANYPLSFLNIRTDVIDSSILSGDILYSKGKNLTEQRYGKFEVVVNGNGYVSGIEIDYSGSMRGKIIKPDSWIVFYNENKILMVDFGASPIDSIRDYTIFEFTGHMNITKAVATDYSKVTQRIRAQVSKLKGDQFDNTDSIWDNNSENFDRIGVERKNEKKIINISSDPTYTDAMLFYDNTGTKYSGFVRIDGGGTIVTANKEPGLYTGKLFFRNGKEANLKNSIVQRKRKSRLKRKRY